MEKEKWRTARKRLKKEYFSGIVFTCSFSFLFFIRLLLLFGLFGKDRSPASLYFTIVFKFVLLSTAPDLHL